MSDKGTDREMTRSERKLWQDMMRGIHYGRSLSEVSTSCVYLISSEDEAERVQFANLMGADPIIMGIDLSVEGLEYFFGWARHELIVIESDPDLVETNIRVIKEAIELYDRNKVFRHIQIHTDWNGTYKISSRGNH